MDNINSKAVPLLVTLDLEIAHDHELVGQEEALERLGNDLDALGIPITIFATSDAVGKFPGQVIKLKGQGNEVGLHGKTHSREENFALMPLEAIKRTINDASAVIESITGAKPVCFRGPFMSTSALTQRILIEKGFTADLSVCSQRVDVLNAAAFRREWLTAPRKPYYPSESSPYKRGKMPLMVIPASCIGLPFFSGTLYLFGLKFMKIFFNILYKEAQLFKKPVLYMFHSYEFSECKAVKDQKRLHRLYIQRREERYYKNLNLLKYICAKKNIQPMTCSGFVRFYREYL